MKFYFNRNVLDYIKSKGVSELTIDMEEIPINCCLGRLPEMNLILRPPKNPEGYRHFHHQGIDIHLSKLLRTQKTVKLFLSGLGPFKKLEVSGVNLIL